MRITIKQLKQLIREAVEEELGSSSEPSDEAFNFAEDFEMARNKARSESYSTHGAIRSEELQTMLENNEELLEEIFKYLKTRKRKQESGERIHSQELAKFARFASAAETSNTFEEFKDKLIKKYEALGPEESESEEAFKKLDVLRAKYNEALDDKNREYARKIAERFYELAQLVGNKFPNAARRRPSSLKLTSGTI